MAQSTVAFQLRRNNTIVVAETFWFGLFLLWGFSVAPSLPPHFLFLLLLLFGFVLLKAVFSQLFQILCFGFVCLFEGFFCLFCLCLFWVLLLLVGSVVFLVGGG